jgi:hypothetical protein
MPAPAVAQIVNVQGQLAKAPEHDGANGQLELKLDWREGNNSLFDVGASGALIVRQGRWLGLAIASGQYATSRGTTLTQKAFEHIRARYTIDCRWRWEAFAQHEYDKFRRLSVRALLGTGPALQIVNEPTLGLLAGAAYMTELEQFDKRDGTIDAGARAVNHRASVYLTGIEKIGSQVAIVETIYIQPRLDDPRDLRLLGELSLTTKLSKRIALIDGFSIAYDRTPPDGVKRLDTQLKIGLLVTL